MLVALSPGFGSGLVMGALCGRLSPLHCPEPRWAWAAAGATAVVLIVFFAWLDALLNPSLPKPDGHPSWRDLGRSAGWFGLGQIFVLPVIFFVTAGIAENFLR